MFYGLSMLEQIDHKRFQKEGINFAGVRKNQEQDTGVKTYVGEWCL